MSAPIDLKSLLEDGCQLEFKQTPLVSQDCPRCDGGSRLPTATGASIVAAMGGCLHPGPRPQALPRLWRRRLRHLQL